MICKNPVSPKPNVTRRLTAKLTKTAKAKTEKSGLKLGKPKLHQGRASRYLVASGTTINAGRKELKSIRRVPATLSSKPDCTSDLMGAEKNSPSSNQKSTMRMNPIR